MLFFIYSLALLYIVLILVYRYGWQQKKQFEFSNLYIPKTSISIIIPARNEEHNIVKCLNAVLAQDYPKELFEVIVVDDHSTDRTYQVVTGFETDIHLRCIKLSEHVASKDVTSYKKLALSTGISQANGDLIVTTDADTFMQKDWLKSIAALYEEKQPVMIVGPVCFTNNNKIVEVFQSLDFISMQGVTVATLKLRMGNMCNGANLAFSKKAFNNVKGYEGIDHIASGDDYLLMTKMRKYYPDGIKYLNTDKAIVSTPPQPDWSSFFQQRIRWASKSGKYNDYKLTAVLMLVYLFNLVLLITAVVSFFQPEYLLHLLVIVVCKGIAELLFLYPVAKFYGKVKELILFPIFEPLHISYIVLAGFLGFVGKYEWKGRSVK